MKELLKIFAVFFKIGLFTFGGGLAMLPMIQRAVVDDRKWMTESEMVDCLAICQSLPGVVAVNTATYVGKTRKGAPGAVFASLGVIMPSFIIIILASMFLAAIGDNTYIKGAFAGVKAASCALILYSGFKLGKQVLKGKFAWAVAVLGFGMIVFLRVTAVWAILAGALAGLLFALSRGTAK